MSNQWVGRRWSATRPVENALALPGRSTLSLLAGHSSALNTHLVVVHFVSDRCLRRNESLTIEAW
jgi:hypothetical protein